MPDPIPYAHLGHYLWILYVLPVLIVVASIVKTTISEKRKAREEPDGVDSDNPPGSTD